MLDTAYVLCEHCEDEFTVDELRDVAVGRGWMSLCDTCESQWYKELNQARDEIEQWAAERFANN